MTDPFLSVHGQADDPETVAAALHGLGSAVNSLDRNMMALVGLLGFLVGRAGPEGSAMHSAAREAIAVFRAVLPDVAVIGGFEEAMRLGATPPDTDGGGLPLVEGLRRNIDALMRKVA